ncbi:MAG: HmuY family protein [Chitinophagaceae bacterium]|nr:HmuY family protein [Chitinophagaceae bacterium]MCW5925879.1 HmuY family protein [Chitinophagaceae bacterium]
MKQLQYLLAILFMAAGIVSCKESDPLLPDNLANFESNETGFDADITEKEVKINLSRVTNTDITVTVSLEGTGVTYGTEFTTTPAASGNNVAVVIPSGSSSGSFKLIKKDNVFLSGEEKVKFTLLSASSPVLVGTTKELTVSFSSIVSEGSQLTLEGKIGPADSVYFNAVYADFSNNSQLPVGRKTWNLGFESGSEFRVILNPGYQSTAAAINKTDLADFVISDTTGVGLDHNIEDPSTVALVDYWDGDLTKTAIAPVSATDSENKVYLLSFQGSKERDKWYKLKITRNGNGYRIQYALVGETTLKTLDIPKNDAYNFTFVSLETDKIVDVEPQKEKWDIMWGYSTYNSGLGSPYWFQDFVLLNYVGGAQAAEVLESAVTYDAFAESNIAALTFSGTRDVIGSKWRQGAGPSGPGTIRRDRFYVVKDPSGNVYKLKFVSWGGGGDSGERGKPVIEYKLVKKG